MAPRSRSVPASPASAVQQNKAAFADEADLAERFGARLRLFAARRLRDTAEAEDVAQETLRRVLEALRTGRVENLVALPAFVFETARHLCLQRHRSGERESRALHRLHDGGADRDVRAAPDPLTALVREERRAVVREALERLNRSDRELLRMLYFDGIETAEAAHRLAITAAAVRVRKHRALKRLSERLREQGP